MYLVAVNRLRHSEQLPDGGLMKTIQPTETLLYYDGVEVFVGQDPIGGHYVGMIIDAIDPFDRYLVTGVSPERLRQFRSGVLDLRTLFLEAPGGEWYLTRADGQPGEPLTLELQDGPLSNTEFIPEAGFVLDEAPIDDSALLQARERGNVIFEFSAEPPEAAAAHRIRMATLGGLLVQIQTVISHAYRSAIRELSDQSRRSIDTTDGHLMNVVVPAASGSFRVILEAAKSPDMFGYGELARALQRMDAVFASADDPKTARERLQAHKGHLAGSYIKLMRLLAENNTGLRYAWAHPMLTSSRHGGVSEGVAKELVELLSGVTNLSTESITLIGEFERVNRRAGDWGLLTDEGLRTGKTEEGGPSLNGLEVGRVYSFHCLEEIELIDATGSEKHTLYLQRIESA